MLQKAMFSVCILTYIQKNVKAKNEREGVEKEHMEILVSPCEILKD